MMKYATLIVLAFLVNTLYSQGELEGEKVSINDFNFESTTNPAFTLLEEGSSQINAPTNLKALSTYFYTSLSSQNIAVEVNPYWFFKKEDLSYRKYRGIKVNEEGKEYIDALNGIQTNTSFTIGYLSKKFEGFEEEKQTLAIGFRTTLLKIHEKGAADKLTKIIKETEVGVTDDVLIKYQNIIRKQNELSLPDDTFCSLEITDARLKPYLEVAQNALRDSTFIDLLNEKNANISSAEELLQKYLDARCEIVTSFVNNPKTIKPILRLDAATAYSWLFKENSLSAGTRNRFGTWITSDFAYNFSKENYIHLYGIAKYVNDEFQRDEIGNFSSDWFWDAGFKAELEMDRIKISYEYLNRLSNNNNNFRSVGNITYQINPKLSITGGFGKDFSNEDNLVTLLGINWGVAIENQIFTRK